MIPLVKLMAPAMGGEQAIMLAVVVAGFAECSATPIRFMGFLKVGFPLMLLIVAVSHIYMYLRYL